MSLRSANAGLRCLAIVAWAILVGLSSFRVQAQPESAAIREHRTLEIGAPLPNFVLNRVSGPADDVSMVSAP